MKIASSQSGAVLRDAKRFAGILLHGVDPGLVREWAVTAARGLDPANDPFVSCVLAKEEHGRVFEEARSLSFAGGRRVVRVLEAGDALASVAGRLDQLSNGALVIFEAGQLPARSKLRQVAEAAANLASIACQPESGAVMGSTIRRAAAVAGTSLTEDATAFLVAELGSDTGVRQSELAKLFTFAAGEGQIDLEMAVQCCAPVGDVPLDALLAAVMAGRVSEVATALPQVVEDGATGPGLVIALSGRLQRILKLRLEMKAGRTPDQAVRGLSPPVFFRDMATLIREAETWPDGALSALLADSRAADIACKRGGSRDATIAGRLYLAASLRAARLRRS